MFSTLSSQIGALIMAAVCFAALLTRMRPQALVAATVFVAWVGSAALENRANFADPQYAIFVLDLVALAVFTGLALRFRRPWLMWVAVFQLLTAATHVAVMIDLRIFVRAYLTAYLIWSYLLLAAVAWGAVEGWRERRC